MTVAIKMHLVLHFAVSLTVCQPLSPSLSRPGQPLLPSPCASENKQTIIYICVYIYTYIYMFAQ